MPTVREEPGDGPKLDFRQMAYDLAKKNGIPRRKACQLIIKEHGQKARDAFKVGRLPD